MADWLPENWSLPQLLLVGLALAVAVSGVVAASSSQSAFGAYNAGWDGASDLRDVAGEQGAEPVVARNASTYADVEPNGTVAVLLSPTEPYAERERDRVASFVADGGTLVIAEDFGPHTTPLLETLGAETRVDGAPLRDEQEYYRSPALPVATNVSDAPETEGVEQLTLNHGTSLRTNASAADTTVLVSSSEFAYLDRDRDGELDDDESLASRPVAVRESVGDGTVYVVSDPSVFINAMLDRPDNGGFTRSLLSAERVLFDYSHTAEQPPLRRALLTLQDSSVWQLSLGLLGVGAVVWSRRLRRWLAALRGRVGTADSDDALVTAQSTGDGPLEAVPPTDDGALDGTPPTDDDALATADPDDVIAYLSRRYPDWDERRLRRVMRGIKRVADGTQDDD